MITKRDKEVIRFLNDFKAAHTSSIKEIFFPSERVAQRRLKNLCDLGELKRERYFVSEEYFYYKSRKPKNLQHTLLLTDFYREIVKLGLKIEQFIPEITLGEIRPDGLLGYRYKNKGYLCFVEVELSNKGLDIDKYKRFLVTEQYKEYNLPIFPTLIAITNQRIPKCKDFKIIQIREDLSNIGDLIKNN